MVSIGEPSVGHGFSETFIVRDGQPERVSALP